MLCSDRLVRSEDCRTRKEECCGMHRPARERKELMCILLYWEETTEVGKDPRRRIIRRARPVRGGTEKQWVSNPEMGPAEKRELELLRLVWTCPDRNWATGWSWGNVKISCYTLNIDAESTAAARSLSVNESEESGESASGNVTVRASLLLNAWSNNEWGK